MSAASSIESLGTEQDLKPSDFCFYVQEDDRDGDTIAYFCPLRFFKDNGHMSDEYYDALDEFVPADMDEMADSCYGSSRSVAEVRAELLALGFVEDPEFTKFMSDLGECEPSVVGTVN